MSVAASYLFLYSTNTWLAYAISQQYFNKEHFVWCAPYFDADSLSSEINLPPTSTPKEIYLSLSEEVARGDKHSPKIRDARRGIVKGAKLRLDAGLITNRQWEEIYAIVRNGEVRDFKPLIYVISYALVEPLLNPVPIKQRAHPLSPEYQIERLPRHCFEILDMQ